MINDTNQPDDQTPESAPFNHENDVTPPANSNVPFGGGRKRGKGRRGGPRPAHGHGRGPGYGGCPGHCISDLQPGQRGRIVGYRPCHRGYKRKLLQMGLVRGAEFTVLRIAPLGDPVEIEVGGFHLTLRKHEANVLVVDAV